MMHSTSHYAAPRCESQIWSDWLHSERVANSSWGSSTGTMLVDDSDLSETKDVSDDPLSLCYSFTPPSPNLPFSDESSSSQLSIGSTSDYDELPEIPFISSTSLRYHNGWNQTNGHSRNGSDDSNCERSFWASVIRPSTSQSSDKGMPVLGHLNERVLLPKRERAPSISSTASSRTRLAPAKSILSSSSSIRTRTGRSPSSVKFLDMPTIHYEEDYEEDLHRASTVPVEKQKSGFLRWFLGSGSSKKSESVPDRPTISGPFPLWETPPRRGPGGTTSLRSMKSNNSLRSIRSCSSRLQTYWSRVTRKDP